PAFIASATGRKVFQRLRLAGEEVHLTDLVIQPGGGLVGQTVGEVQAEHRVNIVMHQGPAGVAINPDHGVALGAEDTILVIAPMARLSGPGKTWSVRTTAPSSAKTSTDVASTSTWRRTGRVRSPVARGAA